jgi:ubiquinone/menaquinone biosynthesis C-methylase UbiE
MLADLPSAVARRQTEDAGSARTLADPTGLPDYYAQDFHFQTGGYLTEESAKLYDTQVEVLFAGTANAMRRQCLVPIAEFMKGRDQRQMSLLDVASGTGRFARFVKQAYPRMKVMASDLSDAYLDEAREHMKPYTGVAFQQAKAEALPFADQSFDIVTSIYLFHEVPPKVRREIAQEFARVLKPGGILVFMDSIQYGDIADFDGLLDAFPIGFHEPYYPSYVKEDLARIFGEAGLEVTSQSPQFLSKLVVARKPDVGIASDIGDAAAERGD